MESEYSQSTSQSPLRATSRSTLRATSRSTYRSTSRSTLGATSRPSSRSRSRSTSRPASRPASRHNVWAKAAKYITYVVVLLVAISLIVSTIGPITIDKSSDLPSNTTSDLPSNTSSDLPSQHRQYSAEFLAKKAKIIDRYGEEYYIKAYDIAPGLKAITKLYCHPQNLGTSKAIADATRYASMLGEYSERLDQTVADCMRRTSMLKRAFDRFDSGLLSPEFVAREDHMTQVAMYKAVMAFDRARSAMCVQGGDADVAELMQQIDAAVTRVEKTKGKKGLGR